MIMMCKKKDTDTNVATETRMSVKTTNTITNRDLKKTLKSKLKIQKHIQTVSGISTTDVLLIAS